MQYFQHFSLEMYWEIDKKADLFLFDWENTYLKRFML